MLDLVITGGQVVTPQTVREMDVSIRGEKIAAVGWSDTLAGDAGRVIDATRKIVIPGGIEPHAHIGIPVPSQWSGLPDIMRQPPQDASRAAAFGGVTTIVDFAGDWNFEDKGDAPPKGIMSVLEERRDVFRTHAYADYTFHYILAGEVVPETITQIGEAIQEGIASFKIFTTFHPIRVPYGHLSALFAEVAKHGGIMTAHAEAQNAGQPVYGEALHNYLQFTCEDYKRPGGTAIHTYPTIKFAGYRDALIAGLMDGQVATTAADEYTTHKGPKLWGDTIQSVCGKHSGIETRIPVAFTKFVAERSMPLQCFVNITSANAAKLLGLYPRKGATARQRR